VYCPKTVSHGECTRIINLDFDIATIRELVPFLHNQIVLDSFIALVRCTKWASVSREEPSPSGHLYSANRFVIAII
jgi:hypothetical protein